MTQLSPYQVLLTAYPGSIRSNRGERVLVKTIRDYEQPDDLTALRERLATIVSDLNSEFVTYLNDAEDRQQTAHEQVTDNTGLDEDVEGTPDPIPDAFNRFQDQSATSRTASDATDGAVEFSYGPRDIELAELTESSTVVAVPYPRAYRCTSRSCGHFSIWSPEDVRTGKHCPHDFAHEMRRFPYVFVCPRCAHTEQASPHRAMQGQVDGATPEQIVSDDESKDHLNCPNNTCSGHLHVNLGDRLSGVQFTCTNCSDQFRFEGDCPECHKPATDVEDAVKSEMRPKTIDANKTQPLIIEDIVSDHGTTLDELRQQSRADQASEDEFHWNLETITSASEEIVRDTFGLSDIFTVSSVDSVSAVYGYEATVTARNTNLDEKGRLTRTFQSADSSFERRAYLTRRGGRGIVFQLQKDRLAEVITGDTDDYDAIAEHELRLLNEEMSADDMANSEELELVPLLHAYQHAIYQAAIEEAGLEDFLASKLLIESGAIALVEKRNVGAGGLSQVTASDTGGVLLRTLQRAEEILKDCARDCDGGCLSCVFTEDARCHPFVSREVEGYVPANSLLNRQLASEVIRRA